MGIYKLGEQFGPQPGAVCMLCDKPLIADEPIVMWSGPADLCLHGSCAGTFVLRLARDAWEVERDANDGKYTLTVHGSGWRMPDKD
jgi:hypothetical protein